MSKGRVLVIDDEVNILKVIELSLTAQDFMPEVFNNSIEGLNRAKQVYFDLAFLDLKMEPIDGLKVLSELKKISPETTIVMMTAYASVETAVEAIKMGAYDYIIKPFNHKEFSLITERIYTYHKLLVQVSGLKEQVDEFDGGDIITKNSGMIEILKMAKDIAESDIPVLIQGESGTGKELLARYIHQNSLRKRNPFVAINCAAIPDNLFESELFGHVRGSFTGAIKDRIGRFEMADQGTIFLDEVTELNKTLQVKLLRFLQNMEFERIGENIPRKVDVRIICATNRSITENLKSGELREDFYYRLNGITITLPPLRERKDDISVLTEHFLNSSVEDKLEVEPDVMNLLRNYDWPGNIRELENVINRAKVLSKNKIIKKEYLPFEITKEHSEDSIYMIPTLEEIEKGYIKEVLDKYPAPKDAAQILGISVTTLWRKRKEYNI
jgi:DNA-binding NtrC family response regulator